MQATESSFYDAEHKIHLHVQDSICKLWEVLLKYK
jgi:hypothetical protein